MGKVMRKKMQYKAPVVAAVICLLTFFAAFTESTWAEVSYSPNSTGDAQAIYVAGNPNLYPLEYFNPTTNQYDGIIPSLFEIVSDETGLNFCYINVGEKDRRKNLAKNGQVDIVSGIVEGGREEKYITSKSTIISVPMDGDENEICLGYTAVASKQTVDEINSVLNDISPQEISRLAIAYTIGNEVPIDYTNLLIALGAVMVVGLFTICIIIMRLVIKHKNAEAMMTDKFTGIGNKEYFKQTFEMVAAEHNRDLYYVAYISFDISWVNQYLGFEEGNHRLLSATDIIKKLISEDDIAARVAGGSFAILFKCSSLEKAEAFAKKITKLLNKGIAEHKAFFRMGVFSLKIELCDSDTAIKNAKTGYEEAVSKNKNFIFCNEDLIKRTSFEIQIQEQIEMAIRRKEFVPYAQFVINGKDESLLGIEMLSRWHSSELGLIFPSNYISIMEKSGDIVELDFYIFGEVCKTLEQWSPTEKGNLAIACNFSRITLSQPDFTDRLIDIASKYEYNRNNFVLEITEEAIESNKELANRNVERCKEFGFRIGLDDLGSGYTTFMNLCDYPIDVIKIDRSIMAKSTKSKRGFYLLQSIIEMAHKMNIRVVCEGIENEAQSKFVKHMGTDGIQGHLYSKVIPLAECGSYIDRHRLLSHTASKV